MDNRAPKKIYLTCYGENPEENGEDIFWSESRINDTDEEYYHASEIERTEKEKEWLLQRLLKDIPCTKKELIKIMNQALEN